MASLSAEQLRRLARLGAITRLEQLRREEAEIRAEFPELFGRGRRAGANAGVTSAPAGKRRQRRKGTGAA